MYRTELEPQPLYPRRVQQFRLLVVAVLAFTAGATSVAYPYRLGPFDSGVETATPAPAAASRPAVPADEVWGPPVPATSSGYHGQPQRRVPAIAAGELMPGCVWTPPVPATSSVYSGACVQPPAPPARHAP